VERLRIRAILDAVPTDAFILEIGAGYNPQFVKSRYPNAFHMDHMDTEALREKFARDPNVAYLVHRIQPVDFVVDGRRMEEVVPSDLRFDIVYSSHVVEHQVDLIGHFISLEKILRSDGRAIIIIPDHRCCFDALRFPTTIGDALEVRFGFSSVHRRKQILDYISRTININPNRRLYRADLAAARFNRPIREGFEVVLKNENPDARYEDAHAWVFTPVSFRLLMLELYLLGFTRLRPVSVSRTYGNQFCGVLKLAASAASLSDEQVDELERERLRLSKLLMFG
jgi:hypothetical protein